MVGFLDQSSFYRNCCTNESGPWGSAYRQALAREEEKGWKDMTREWRHIDEVQSNEVLIGKELYPISRNYRDEFFKKLDDRKLL